MIAAGSRMLTAVSVAVGLVASSLLECHAGKTILLKQCLYHAIIQTGEVQSQLKVARVLSC